MAQNGNEPAKTRTGYVWNERYMWHHAGKFTFSKWIQPVRHFESPESKRRFHNLLDLSGLLDRLVRLKPREATEEEVKRFHTPEYVAKIKALSADHGGEAGDCATFSKGAYEVALLSAGGVLTAVDAVMTGQVDNAYALVRPPGHHAERDRGMGFCIFANVSLAAMHAKAAYGLKRVAIVDYDVHHGNGTQQAFYNDPEVLFISVHQDSNYPAKTGYIEERGAGAGEYFNINVPLPPGCGGGAYEATFDRVVVPALRAFRPELILVSSGFDGGYLDPLSAMMLSSEHFRSIGKKLNDAAKELCAGRIVFAHEGGYSDVYVPFCGLAVVEEMSGVRTEVTDVLLNDINHWGYHELQANQEAVIKRAEGVVEEMRKRVGAKA